MVPHRRSYAESGVDPKTGLPRILLVDDEPAVLSALYRNLRPYYAITTAEGGTRAVELLASKPDPFMVAVTDMRMPEVDGVGVLKALREQSPDTVRMLLTGYAEVDSAIAAVNEGNLFRFLTKPTSTSVLRTALDAAVGQYRLVMAEREVLEGTLHGSVRALIDTLALANPAAFGRAMRIKDLVDEVLDRLHEESRWEIEIAAMCSQLGAVTLTPTVVDKLRMGARLSEVEQAMVDRIPQVSVDLLADIPRLDGVRAILNASKTWTADSAPFGAKLIHLATYIDEMETRNQPFEAILASLRSEERSYGERLLAAVTALKRTGDQAQDLVEVVRDDLQPGMVLAGDVVTIDGALLVGRGQTVTDSVLRRLHNFAQGGTLTQDRFFVIRPG